MRFLSRGLYLLALAGLSGCHTTNMPPSSGLPGTRTVHTLRQEPHRAAVCIARNIDNRRPAYTARIRQGVEPVLIEVHVSADELISLAQLLIDGAGSTAVIWMAPDRIPADDIIPTMIAGC
jgi:hypothetical protein